MNSNIYRGSSAYALLFVGLLVVGGGGGGALRSKARPRLGKGLPVSGCATGLFLLESKGAIDNKDPNRICCTTGNLAKTSPLYILMRP